MSVRFSEVWTDLGRRLGLSGPAWAAVGEDLQDRYSGEGRYYHDVSHIEAVLASLEELCGRPSVVQQLAAFYHDAVYLAAASDNEEQSARLAERQLGELGVEAGVIEAVVTAVEATATHSVPAVPSCGITSEEIGVFLDADLAVLAAPPDEYTAYRQAIRREYAHLDEDTFASGRLAVLERFMERPELFFSAAGQRLDAPARANLRAEIAALRCQQSERGTS